jgi:hypothetical protein
MQFQARAIIPIVAHGFAGDVANRIDTQILIEFYVHNSGGLLCGEVNLGLRVHHLAHRIE